MLKTRVIPVLLLKNQGLVKTVRFKDPKYIGDPINTVKIFNEKEVDELVFLDIGATADKSPVQIKLLAEIAGECFMPLGYGGGVRTLDDVKAAFGVGIEKVVINSMAAEDLGLVERAAALYGNQSIVVSIDVRKSLWGRYAVHTRGGRQKTKLDPVKYAAAAERAGAGELLLTAIDLDGTMKGYDLDLVSRVSQAVGVPVVACGGAGQIADFTRAVEAGASAVGAGSMFVYQGRHRAVLINFPTQAELHEALP